jgi:hypothetical protein
LDKILVKKSKRIHSLLEALRKIAQLSNFEPPLNYEFQLGQGSSMIQFGSIAIGRQYDGEFNLHGCGGSEVIVLLL